MWLVQWHDKAVAVSSLGRAVASFPKHKNGFWLEVAMAVGSRSAAECQQKYVEEQQARGSKRQAKSSTTSDKPQRDIDVLVLGISLSLHHLKLGIYFVVGVTGTRQDLTGCFLSSSGVCSSRLRCVLLLQRGCGVGQWGVVKGQLPPCFSGVLL